uniref:ADF-H domain-containing protein n=1 Tax=Emiliania huxleyi (strain CCMP1516) TaxID=280463 RepID=A0A0D3JRT7_EMIH1
MSGVQVNDDCKTAFEDMKIRSKYPYIIFKISDDKKSIEIEKKGDSFDDFTKNFPDNDCRYAVLDVEIKTKSGATANKLVFVSWSDDNASIKPKMLYASSKDALKKELTGIYAEYQATDRSELDLDEIKKKAGGVRLVSEPNARPMLQARAS